MRNDLPDFKALAVLGVISLAVIAYVIAGVVEGHADEPSTPVNQIMECSDYVMPPAITAADRALAVTARMVDEARQSEPEAEQATDYDETVYEYQESDYADLSAIYQDAENMKYFGAPYDDKMMRRLIDWTMNNYKKYGFGFWAIIDKKSGEFIGDCGLSMQLIDGEWLPEIGYHIKLKYHNMGYASEAAKLVKAYIFRNYAFDALYGYTTEDNVASIKVMIKNGMSFVKKYTKDQENYVVYCVRR